MCGRKISVTPGALMYKLPFRMAKTEIPATFSEKPNLVQSEMLLPSKFAFEIAFKNQTRRGELHSDGVGCTLSASRKIKMEIPMKILAAIVIALFVSVSTFAQSQSLWIEDHPNEDVLALVDGGKTTLLYVAGGLHADGPAVPVGKHMFLTRYVAQQVAEKLGNALILPINPYVIAEPQIHGLLPGNIAPVGAGTISISEDLFILLTKAVVDSSLTAVRLSQGLKGTGYKNVILMGDHTQVQTPLKECASELDEEWKGKGVRVYYVNLGDKSFAIQSITKLNKGVKLPGAQTTPIEDENETLAVNPATLRQDKVPVENRPFLSPEFGKSLVEHKINTMVEQIQALTAAY